MALNTFRYKDYAYTPKHNLEEVAKTYDYLQQRHDLAIEKENLIQQKFAELDLNSAEDEWRANKMNELQTMINDASIDGFKGYALNDIITQGTKMLTGADVRGRLKAQQQYKQYIEDLDKRTDLSEDYKNVFKEINTYSYQDKFDDNGNIIGGTDWKPTKEAVSEIPLINILKGGIELAAKDAGRSNITRFLDKNGKVITDPTADNVFDGQVYNTTTNQWESLGRDKIMKGIQAYIETTPGAKASLKQDYDVAIYKQNKYGANPDVEDKNGVTLSPEQYLQKRLEPGIQAAIYNRSYTTTTYGNGLATYKAALKAQQKQLQDPYRLPGYSTEGTPITINYDYAANLQTDKQNSIATLNGIVKTITGEGIKQDMSNATSADWKNLIETTVANSNLTPAEKSKLILESRKAIRKLEEANINYKELTKGITDETQLDALNFISKVNGGAEIDANTGYGKAVINEINSIFGDKGKYIRMTTDNEDYFNKMKSLISGNNINGLKELGYTIGTDNKGNKYIQLDKDNYNQIISFANAAKEARDVINMFGSDGIYFTSLTSDYDINKSFDKPILKTMQSISRISQLYDDANNTVKRYISEVSPQQITISNENLPYQTFTEQKLLHDYTLGKIDEQQYNLYDKQLKADLENKLISANYPQVNIFTTEDTDGVGTLSKQIESEDRLEVGKLIKAAVGAGRYKASAAHNAVQGNGTNITIYAATDQDGTPKGDAQTFFIPGLILEQAANEFDNSPKTIASDKITLGNETNRKIYLTSSIETPTLGGQTIDCLGNNQFVYKTDTGTYPISRKAAVDITESIENYHQIKDSLISGDIYQDTSYTPDEINDAIKEQINNIAAKIATAYGRLNDYEYIRTSLLNDLKE
jgi:hypothetical protein